MINLRSAATTEASETPDLEPVLDFMRLLWHVEHGILQRLEKKGLLRRERDRGDHRRIRLYSQVAARACVAASTGTVESAVTHALTRVPIYRVRHAREVPAAIASALADDRATAEKIEHRRSAAMTRADAGPLTIGRPGYAGPSLTESGFAPPVTLTRERKDSVKCVHLR